MKRRQFLQYAGMTIAATGTYAQHAFAASRLFPARKIKTLLIDGENNSCHNWRKMRPVTKAILEATGRFTVDISQIPANNAPKEEWDKWKPEFAKYAAVVSNYNDQGKCRWPEERRREFEKYISGGGGFVTIHAADNSSADWPAYNEMIGAGGWGGRKPKDGSLLRKKDGKWVPDPAPKGRSGSHGSQWPYPVKTEAPDHPIMKGLPPVWIHFKDELYNSLRGPCKNVTVLASAPSRQTKLEEPAIMLIEYGKGRICHLIFCHVGNINTMKCVGFQTVLARGTEFVATGKVTIPVPPSFPTKDKASVKEPSDIKWK